MADGYGIVITGEISLSTLVWFERELPRVLSADRNEIVALAAGCISIEADVWLYDDVLYVSFIIRL